ncbi:MAG: MBL fold metallo-hydrolase [Spirochaetia bacterium]|nr:MBL fold metallo-hydrolase [Spirochaetia bacterium]MCF7952582.1 MBL fold metallo-hydrolase [Spirochaetales bacterium]
MKTLKPVDICRITVIVDNYADTLLESSPGVERFPSVQGNSLAADTLLAEHGISLLVETKSGKKWHSVIFDAGYSPIAAPRNYKMLGLPEHLKHAPPEALVISHGHEDHVGALDEMMTLTGNPLLVIHPEAFTSPRFWKADDGRLYRIPVKIDRGEINSKLKSRGSALRESASPLYLGDNTILVTGEIPRVTSYERGMPGSVKGAAQQSGKDESAEDNQELIPDQILDDQALVVDVKDRGLVVITGCGHAGIINTTLYAKTLTGIDQIEGVAGGFHLSGKEFSEIVIRTAEDLHQMNPHRVIPMHCTGLMAKEVLKNQFKERYVESSVGTVLAFPFQ